MEEETSMVGIERTSSIENEPRTLSFSRLQCAREAAEYVVNTKSVEEALRIFTEGLIPVTNSASNDEDKTKEFDEEEFEEEEFKYCRKLMRKTRPKDIASAPF